MIFRRITLLKYLTPKHKVTNFLIVYHMQSSKTANKYPSLNINSSPNQVSPTSNPTYIRTKTFNNINEQFLGVRETEPSLRSSNLSNWWTEHVILRCVNHGRWHELPHCNSRVANKRHQLVSSCLPLSRICSP